MEFENLFICEKPLMAKVIETLNDIPVKGKDNLDKLLGVILVLEQGMNAPKPETKTETIPLGGEEETTKE